MVECLAYQTLRLPLYFDCGTFVQLLAATIPTSPHFRIATPSYFASRCMGARSSLCGQSTPAVRSHACKHTSLISIHSNPADTQRASASFCSCCMCRVPFTFPAKLLFQKAGATPKPKTSRPQLDAAPAVTRPDSGIPFLCSLRVAFASVRSPINRVGISC